MNGFRLYLPLAVCALVGLIVGWMTQAINGWAIFALLLAVLHWRDLERLRRVGRWARQPDTSPPAHIGGWDATLAPLYRHLRAQIRELQQRDETVQVMMAAAQALPDGVVALNQEFHIDWCNRTARDHLGLKLSADRGQSLLNVLRAPEFVDYVRHPESWHEPKVIRVNRQGQERLLVMQLTRFAGVQHLLVTRDKTQAERLETTRRDFVANVSHELRTPLTVLAGFLETFRDMPDDALPVAQRDQYLQMMLEQAQRMQAIVADLLTLSTLESSPSSPPHPIAVRGLLETIRQQVEALSGGQHSLVWDIDDSLDVLGAETELASAFANLVTNAVRYTPPGGHIVVRWQADAQGNGRYSVQDDGIGIAARHLPRLTERFYRVDRSRSRESGGTGLGLAITKHIAMRHEARLEIASQVGKGSTFTLIFPAERVTRAAASTPSSDVHPAIS